MSDVTDADPMEEILDWAADGYPDLRTRAEAALAAHDRRVQAEALEAAARAMPSQITLKGGGLSIDYLGGFNEWLWARAAELRKAAHS